MRKLLHPLITDEQLTENRKDRLEMNRKRPTKRELLERAKAEQAPALDTPEEPSATVEPTDEEVEEVLDGLGPQVKEDDGSDDPMVEAETGVAAEQTGALPMPRLVTPASSTLVAHCDARKITREELAGVPTPEPTRTHQPVPHIRVVETIIEALAFRHIAVVREEYAVTQDGGKMFGVLDLDYEYAALDAFRFSVGLRNANDKTMRLGVTIGYRVFVCDNMAFRGDFTPVLAKHSRRLDLEETIALGVDRMQRGFSPLKQQIAGWQQNELSDARAKLLIYEAFLDRALPLPRHLMPLVHRHYFQPEYEAFQSRTLWSLANAFTSAFKVLKPVSQFQATAKLGSFLTRHETGAAQWGQAGLPVPPDALVIHA